MRSKKSDRNKWFEERQDIFIRNAIRDFLKASQFFRQLHEKYNETRGVAFEDLDCWVGTEMRKGPLWQLKDLCHMVCANEEKMGAERALFDWLIGSIFHEGMKLKENAYLLQHYKPAYEKMRYENQKMTEKQHIEHYLELFKNTTEEVETAMARLNRFFSKACEQLHQMVLKYSDNHLVIRLLVEKESEFDQIWGPNSIARLFEEMFSGIKEKGYCLAAKSYREGNWMENALHAYQKVLDMNPNSEEARQGLRAVRDLIAKQRSSS